MIKRFAAIVFCAASCGGSAPTGPSSHLVGDWTGRTAPDHFGYLDIRFSVEGGRVTGKACAWEAPNHLTWSGVPVTVTGHGDVTLTFPNSGLTYTGLLDNGLLKLNTDHIGLYAWLSLGGDYCASARQ